MDRYDRMSFIVNGSIFIFAIGVIWSAIENNTPMVMAFLAFVVSGVATGIASLWLPE